MLPFRSCPTFQQSNYPTNAALRQVLSTRGDRAAVMSVSGPCRGKAEPFPSIPTRRTQGDRHACQSRPLPTAGRLRPVGPSRGFGMRIRAVSSIQTFGSFAANFHDVANGYRAQRPVWAEFPCRDQGSCKRVTLGRLHRRLPRTSCGITLGGAYNARDSTAWFRDAPCSIGRCTRRPSPAFPRLRTIRPNVGWFHEFVCDALRRTQDKCREPPEAGLRHSRTGPAL